MPKIVMPRGIKLISWATTIRWIGWGFFEAFIPIFLFAFAQSYSETGLLASTYNIVYLLTLPLVGMLADRIATKKLIILGLLIYPFIGASYFLAGLTGIATFVVLARALNGIAYSCDSVGRITYFMRNAPTKKISSTFGYFDTLTNFWWVIAILAGLLLLQFVQLHWLFLLLIPTSIIALFLVLRVDSDQHARFRDGIKKVFHVGAYISVIKQIKDWTNGQVLIAVLQFFFAFISSLGEVFIPIYAYQNGAKLWQVALIAIVWAVPELFGAFLGPVADKKNNRGIVYALAFVTTMLLLLAFTRTYLMQIIVVTGIGIAFELVELAQRGIVTRITQRDHYGRVCSAMEGINELGGMLGPIAIGIMIDAINLPKTALVLAIITAVIFVFVLLKKSWFVCAPNKRLGYRAQDV